MPIEAAPPRSFVDQLADIVSEPSKPLLELAQAKLGLTSSNQKAAIFPQRSVLPANFWKRVAHPTAVSTTSPEKDFDVVVPRPADEFYCTTETTAPPEVLTYHSDTDSSYADSDNFPVFMEPNANVEETICSEVHVESTNEDSFSQFVDEESIDMNAELERLAKQNEFLVLMLRKVTAKISLNRKDIAAFKARIAQLETPPPKIPTTEIAIQTDDIEEEEALISTQQIDALNWQLKIAHAKIDALAANLLQERARMEVTVAESATRAAQFELEAAQLNAQFAQQKAEMNLQRAEISRYEHIHAVMSDYLSDTGIFIDSSMDANAVDAALKTVPVRQTNLAHANAIFDYVTDSMARELSFLSKLEMLDPTDAAACETLCRRRKSSKKV